MPTKIQEGRTLGALLEHFGLRGRHQLELDEVVVPVAIVADLHERGPDDDRLATAHVQCPDIAATFGKAVFFNGAAAASNWLVTIDWILVSATGALAAPANFDVIQTSNAPLAPMGGSTLSKTFDDQRQANAIPPGEIFADSGPFIGPSVARFSLDPAAGPRHIRIPLTQTLPTFRAIAVVCQTAEVRFNTCFHYVIRPAE